MTEHKDYFLIFSSHYDRDKGIDQGRLCLEHIELGHQNIWKAWSSHATGQQSWSIHRRGGYIPPAYRCPQVSQWKLNLYPVDLKQNKGVAGNFYKIEPFQVKTDRGAIRSDFGIHLDANAPGSLGCIVTDAERFFSFENIMTRLRDERASKIPLIIIYS